MATPHTPPTTRTDREGMKTLVVFVPPEVSHAIKIAAATHQSTVQHIGQRAILEWLDRYNAAGKQVIETIKDADLRTKGARALAAGEPEATPRSAKGKVRTAV